jgi:prepilin-type processing-associated H-X9-DG protein
LGPFGPGWPVQILPFIEQEAIYEMALEADSVVGIRTKPINYYVCPSRRVGFTYNTSVNTTTPIALMDYATATPGDSNNSWDQFWYGNTWSFPTNWNPNYRGIIVRSGTGHFTTTSDVLDGTANTLLASEKFLQPRYYAIGDWHDDSGWADGWDPDIIRYTAYQPVKDTHNPPPPNQGYQFGGAHPGGMNALMGDGSVRSIRHTVSLDLFNRIGNRRDGQPVNPTDL